MHRAPNQIIVNVRCVILCTKSGDRVCLKCRFQMAEIIINCCKLLSIKMILSACTVQFSWRKIWLSSRQQRRQQQRRRRWLRP